MKLDERINKNYKLYSCFNTEQAQEYINSKGYFTDFYENFNDLRKVFYGTCVDIDNISAFSYRLSNSERKESYKFFLPEKYVKEEKEEKKLRPFKNVLEFCSNTDCEMIGSHCITIRSKDSKHKAVLLYTGFCDDSVHLGGYVLTLESLFDHYEFLCKGNWMPFGVEE